MREGGTLSIADLLVECVSRTSHSSKNDCEEADSNDVGVDSVEHILINLTSCNRKGVIEPTKMM